jgi:hypothetical protein
MNYLLAVAVKDDKDATLRGDRPAVLAQYRSIAAATSAGIYPFVHSCDPDLARSWLRYATSKSATDIMALSPAEQINWVQAAWEAFGKAFQSLNLRPYGWSRLRQRCEIAWGGVPPGDSVASPSSPTYWNGRLIEDGELERGRPGQWGGSWRIEGYDMAVRQGVGNRFIRTQGFGVNDVIFGGEDTSGADVGYNFDAVGCHPLDPNQMPDTCFAPTGEVHRLWLQGNGALSGYHLYDEAEIARQFSYGVGAGWDRWAAELSDPAIGSTRLYFLPPIRWYWELLFAPVRGLQIPGYRPQRAQVQAAVAVGGDGNGSARVLGLPAGYDPSLDLSLAEYALALPPEEFVREVMRDVVIRNYQMAANKGIRSPARVKELMGAGADALLDQTEEEGNLLSTMTSAGFTIAGSVAAINPLAGLVAGVGVVVSYVLYKIASIQERYIDVFGRLMPTYESLAYTDVEDQFWSWMRGIGTPPSPDARPTVNLALASRRAAETPLSLARMLALTSLTVTSAIPGTTVAVNGPGEDNEAFPAPWGPRSVPAGIQVTIKVNAPGRVPRELAVSLVPGEQKRLDIASEGMELATREGQPDMTVESSSTRLWPWVVGVGALAVAGAVVYRVSGRSASKSARQNPSRRRRRRR